MTFGRVLMLGRSDRQPNEILLRPDFAAPLEAIALSARPGPHLHKSFEAKFLRRANLR